MELKVHLLATIAGTASFTIDERASRGISFVIK
jgi:hypothetical protein